MIGFAIGNGFSRVGYNLESLRGDDRLIVGCNYLYRDFTPDYIVSLDQRPCEAIRNLKDRQFKWLHLDNLWLYLDDKPLIDIREINSFPGNNSGTIACSFLAKHLKCSTVYMLGFDFYLGQVPFMNNVPQSSWNTMVKDFPGTRFIRVGPVTNKPYFDALDLEFISYQEFDKV